MLDYELKKLLNNCQFKKEFIFKIPRDKNTSNQYKDKRIVQQRMGVISHLYENSFQFESLRTGMYEHNGFSLEHLKVFKKKLEFIVFFTGGSGIYYNYFYPKFDGNRDFLKKDFATYHSIALFANRNKNTKNEDVLNFRNFLKSLEYFYEEISYKKK